MWHMGTRNEKCGPWEPKTRNAPHGNQNLLRCLCITMEQIRIDTKKCTGCGLCVQICPYRVIVVVDKRAEYIARECFLCGHCQAICPEDAVTLPQRPIQLGLTTVEEKNSVIQPGTTNVSELVALMRSRRSCRRYRRDPVPLAILEDLVKIGTSAPSGTNSQSWNFIIVPAIDDIQALGGLVAEYYRRLNNLAANPFMRFITRIIGNASLTRYYHRYHASVAEALRDWDDRGEDRLFHGAAAAILVTGNKAASCPAEDALLATQNILLAAHGMGLGSCLIGFVVEAMRRDPKLRRKAGIGAGEEVYSVIALGYPAVRFLRPANRQVVKPRILKLTDTH